MTALLANYLNNEPKAASMPTSAKPVLIRLALVALAIGIALCFVV